MSLACPGITHCANCLSPLSMNEFGMCKDCEEEQKEKEIEDIYRLNGKLDDENNRLRKEIKEYISENYIPKEAIRELLKKQGNYGSFLDGLKELLGE